MHIQAAALLRIQYVFGEGKTNCGKEENPKAYRNGPFSFLFSSVIKRPYLDKFWPLPKMDWDGQYRTHDGYEIHQSWKRDAGQKYYERVAGDCAFVGNFYPEGE